MTVSQFVTYEDGVKTLKSVADVRTILGVEEGATVAGEAGDEHAAVIGNPHSTTAEDIGAVSVDLLGVANGVATLGADGLVPTEQLPEASVIDLTTADVPDSTDKRYVTDIMHAAIVDMLDGLPDVYPHSHPISQVVGLQAALDAKAGIREAAVGRQTATASNVGSTSSVVIFEGSSPATLTLTSDTTAKKLTISNRGSASVTIKAHASQSILGGDIVLPEAASATAPSSVCIARNPGSDGLYAQWVII